MFPSAEKHTARLGNSNILRQFKPWRLIYHSCPKAFNVPQLIRKLLILKAEQFPPIFKAFRMA